MSSDLPAGPSVGAGYRPGDAAYRRVSAALFAAGLATFAQLYSTQPVLPSLAGRFGLSAAESALSVSAATLGLGLALLVVGPVTEVLGRTPLMHTSLIVSSVVGLLCAVAPSWPILLALRVAQGVALAGLSAVAMAYLREEIHEEAHGRATGLYIGATALGGMLGRLLAAGAGELGGWRWALGAVAVLSLGCTGAARLLLPASRHFHPAPSSLAHARSTARRALADPGLLVLYAVAFVGMGAFVAMYNALGFRLAAPPYVLSLSAAGLVFLSYALGSVSSAYAGRLADRHGRRLVLPIALAVTLVGVGVTLAQPLAVVVAGVALATAGWFAAHGVASGWVSARAHLGGAGAGQAASFYLFAYYAGSSVFGGVSGLAWTAAGWPRVVVVVGGLLVVALVVALTLRRVPPAEPPRHVPDVIGQ